jgi:recombination protein RecA
MNNEMTPTQRHDALTQALSRIEKQYGRGAILRMDRGSGVGDVPVISTGCLGIDLALGVGGVPRGRVVEVFGQESSGKTTLTLHLVAEAQKAGGTCAFIDAEHALDIGWARKLGVDVEKLLVSQPDHGEQALEIADMLVRSGAVDLVVIDSVAALTPRSEIEGEMGDQHVGLQARLMSQALRKLTAAAARSGTTVVFINQIRMKIGVMFGSPETTTGGQALKFYSSVRIEIRKMGSLKNGDDIVASKARVKVVKNKLAPPFREAEVEIRFDRGISAAADLLDRASDLGLVEKSGNWFRYGDERIGQGRDQARVWLEQRPDVIAQLRTQVMQLAGPLPVAVAADEDDEVASADAAGGAEASA